MIIAFLERENRFGNGRVYINGIEGFWNYAKERLMKFHRVSKEKFLYYLKELEFRYNNRDNIEDMVYVTLDRIN